ncbi:50S ribosomal protein L19 [Campylobacterota bacterium]|nr:50S ribosomal protein L19 [Campylobacterota bacterium]
MRNRYIEAFEQAQIAEKKVPDFGAGDTIRIGIRIKEGEKTRVQSFEGVCISIRGEGANKTFTVRKIGANNVGVERIFPLYAESLETIDVLRRGKVARAKLYYLRNLRGKAARIKEIRTVKETAAKN